MISVGEGNRYEIFIETLRLTALKKLVMNEFWLLFKDQRYAYGDMNTSGISRTKCAKLRQSCVCAEYRCS